jgi:GNAT superfamily N-acetyltransferase
MIPSFTSERLGSHDRAAFSCGEERLDTYFHHHAGQDERRHLARTFVFLDLATLAVAGYYTLAAASVAPAALPDTLIKKLPSYSQLPAMLIGRLAVAIEYQGQGVGRLLLADAIRRIAAVDAGVFLIVVDAYSSALAFYAKFGFLAFPDDPDRMYLPMKTARAAVL